MDVVILVDKNIVYVNVALLIVCVNLKLYNFTFRLSKSMS